MSQDVHCEDAAMKVKVETEEEGRVLKPAQVAALISALPYSEKKLLRGLDAKASHAEELAEANSRELGN